MAVADVVTTACVIAAVVTAVEAAGAVAIIDAADVIDMGCSKSAPSEELMEAGALLLLTCCPLAVGLLHRPMTQ